MKRNVERMNGPGRPSRAVKRGVTLGLAGSVLALGGVLALGAAANAANTITPTSGPVGGNTSTTVTIPGLSGVVTASSVSDADTVIGSDGNVYRASDGTKIAAPSGVTMSSVHAFPDASSVYYTALGSDGKAYQAFSANPTTFSAVALPSGVTASSVPAANTVIGSDGNLYQANGAVKIPTPSGVTLSSVHSMDVAQIMNWTALGSNGKAYYGGTSGLTAVSLPTGVTASSVPDADTVIGSDGNVYRASDGTKITAPSGVTMSSVHAFAEGSTIYYTALGSDGKAYYTPYPNVTTFSAVALPSGVTTSSVPDGNTIIGSDGNLYRASTGGQVPTPSGVTLSPVRFMDSNSTFFWTALGSNGKAYYGGTSGLSAVALPSSAAQTVTGVTFGGTAATSFSQNGTTVTAVTPGHTAGPVDVVVSTSAGSTYTLSQAFTYTAPAAVSGLAVSGPDGSGNYTLSGQGDPSGVVTVTDANGNVVGTATPASNGGWSVVVPAGTATPLTVTQTVNGSTSPAVTYDTAPLPVVAPVMGMAAGALGLLALGMFSVVAVRRRRAESAS